VTVPASERNPEPLLRELLRLHDDTQFATGRIAVFQYSSVVVFLWKSWWWRCSITAA
jgi:hypothetical protein